LPCKTAFTELKSVHGSRDLFADSTGVTFHDINRMTPETVKFLFLDRISSILTSMLLNRRPTRITEISDTWKGNILVCDRNSVKFHMMGAHGTYYMVLYQSFEEGVK
jgi:hypothetical protein